jgi:hypothetical protein
MATSRGHFTRQGLHLNKCGKEWLAKQIAANIETSVKLANNVERRRNKFELTRSLD